MEVENAVNQAVKEVASRFDFRGSNATIDYDKTKKEITLKGDSDNRLRSLLDILMAKMSKRGVSLKCLDAKPAEPAGGSTWKQLIKLVEGIPMDKAKQFTALVKDAKLKVQISIQGDQLRVTGKSKDDLQDAMARIKAADFGVDVSFTNYR
jgi:uncharacterized protein YajQ (UPF0234 family)